MWSMLKGKRTYFCALAIGLITVLKTLGYVDETTYTTLLSLFGAGGLAALRASK